MIQPFKIFAALLLLSSCVEVEFKQPMPPNKGTTLEKLPEDIISYFITLEKESRAKKDSVGDSSPDFDLRDPLPENVILKKWKGRYFLNQKEGERWQVIMVKEGTNNSFDVYQLDGSNEETINKLKSLTKAEETFDDDGDLDRILLDPSLKEFKKILKSGAFEKVDLFDEETKN